MVSTDCCRTGLITGPPLHPQQFTIPPPRRLLLEIKISGVLGLPGAHHGGGVRLGLLARHIPQPLVEVIKVVGVVEAAVGSVAHALQQVIELRGDGRGGHLVKVHVVEEVILIVLVVAVPVHPVLQVPHAVVGKLCWLHRGPPCGQWSC